MRKGWLWLLGGWFIVVLGISPWISPGLLAAPRTPTPTPVPPTLTPTPTPSPIPTPTPTATPTPGVPPTPTATPTPDLWLSRVEPETLVVGDGGTLTVYGAGFDAGTVVRLVGWGVLTTTFINPGILQAAVPPNLLPGTYGVAVIRSDGASSTLVSAVKVVPPTPVPTPTPSAPPPGQPVLMLSNYAVSPLLVLPGWRFEVTVEVFNGGSRPTENALISFQTTTFVPVGPTGQYVQHIPINGRVTVRQTFYAPEPLAPGSYPITVIMEGNDFEGKHYQYQATVTVAVGEKAAPGTPQLLVAQAETVPSQIAPGTRFQVQLVVQNAGDTDAKDVTVSVEGGQVAVPRGQGSRVAVGEIAAGDAMTVTLSLVANRELRSGHYTLPVRIDYVGPRGEPLAVQEQVGVEVVAPAGATPRLLITRYSVEPALPAPGDEVRLSLELRNVGDAAARRVFLTWGGANAQALSVLALLGTGNVHYIPEVPAQEHVRVDQRFFVDGKAEPGVLSLPVQLVYENEQGEVVQDTQVIALRIRRRPQLMVRFYEPVGTPLVGEPFRLPIEVVNLANTSLNVSSIEVRSETLSLEDNSLFVGWLEGGTSASLDAIATALAAGPHTLEVSIQYLDDFQKMQEVTYTLTVEVTTPTPPPTLPEEKTPSPAAEEEENGGLLRTIWRLIRGLLGLGS